MKKLFSFLAAALFAGSMSAGVVFDYDGRTKTDATTGTVISGSTKCAITTSPQRYNENKTTPASAITFENGWGNDNTNYVVIKPAEGKFAIGDTLAFQGYFNNSSEGKSAALIVSSKKGSKVWESGDFTDGRNVAGEPSVQTYVLNVDLDSLILSRGSGSAQVTRGNLLTVKVTRPEPVMDTVFYVNSLGWEAVKFYAWGGTGAKITWPGLDMQKADYQLQDADVYYFVAEQGAYPNCIFNNANGAQTADLTWTAGKYYYEGSWYTRAELEEPVEEATYFLVGSFNNWKLDTALPMYDDEITVEWAAGAYEFKVVKDRSWDGALGYSDVDAECSDGGYEQNGTNVKVVLAEDGEVTVAVTEEGKLCLKGDFGGTIVVSTWTIVGVEALMGSNWDVNDPANEMTEVEEGIWTLTKSHVALTAGTVYKYKLVGDHSYSVFQYPVEGDQVLTVTEDGKYDVTFTWDDEDELTATAVPSITTALENNTRVNASKVLVDGQMLIEVDGVRYNVVGVRF